MYLIWIVLWRKAWEVGGGCVLVTGREIPRQPDRLPRPSRRGGECVVPCDKLPSWMDRGGQAGRPGGGHLAMTPLSEGLHTHHHQSHV